MFTGVYGTMLPHDLLCQYQTRTQLPVRIPVPQGTVEKISVNHMVVQSRDLNCDQTVNPASHVWDMFLHFRCHEPNQVPKYKYVHLSKKFHQQREQTDENISVAHGNAYCVCPSFISPTNTVALPLDPHCGCHSLGPPVWHQLWPHSDFQIIVVNISVIFIRIV